MIRRRKVDVLSELPPKRRQRVVLDGLKASKLEQIAKEINKHRQQILSEAKSGGLAAGGTLAEVFWMTGEAKIEAVCAYAKYLLESGQRFLMFAHHRVVLDEIEAVLEQMRVDFVRIDGQTPPAQRYSLAERFQNDENVRVALLSMTAAGTGLTLHSASLVVFAELFWVPGQLLQCEDRAHRHGQKANVDVHYLVAPGTIDDIIFPMVNRKFAHSSKTLDGGSAPMRHSVIYYCRGYE
mmetsp:Transcript_28476/g.39742  ORF Transcript_28476/g.39742 Transcript_28476/m.39742 type:complete len:238 (-) Transcript_28476:149-862(-)